MKKIIFKITLILSVLIMTAGALVSCGDRKYDENEVKAAAKQLIADSVVLNEIYWGEGIAYDDDKNFSDGVYYQAIYTSHYQHGFTTIADLKRITKKTFSKEFSETVFSTVLSSITDGNEIFLTRYYQKYNTLDGKTPECIMVHSEWEPVFTSEVEYDFESIKVLGSEKETVFITIDCTVTKDALLPQKRTVKISLIEEEDGWKIDSPTFVNYDITQTNN